MPTLQYGLPASYHFLRDLGGYFDDEREHERRLELIEAQQAPQRERQRQAAIQRLSQRMMAPAAYGELQGGEFAPSFLETTLAAGQGRLGDLYGQQRAFEMEMARDAAYQEQVRQRQLEVEKQRYQQRMAQMGYEVVPSARGVQQRYDEVSAILKNEGNLSPQQMDMALEQAANKPLDMTVRRKQPSPDELWQQGTFVNPEDGERYGSTVRNGAVTWKQISNKAKRQEAELKHIASTQKYAEELLRDDPSRDVEKPPSPWEIEKKTRELLDMGARIQAGEPLPAPPVQQGPPPETVVPPPPPQPGWIDRAKMMGAMAMPAMKAMATGAAVPAMMQGAAPPQPTPGAPGPQQPPTPVQQIAVELTDLAQVHGENISKWPKEAKEQGKALAQRFQAEIQAQYGDAKNVPADLLPILQLVAKLL
jgi:hypothetical protein